MKLSNVGKVILGALSLGPHSGYGIKRLVDRSTRFFWAASYGQIYPELHRLEERGLVTSSSESQGGRERQMYRVTPRGRRALGGWLTSSESVYELRDENLLRLFFADVLEDEEARELVERMREDKQAVLDRLLEIRGSIPEGARGHRLLVLEYGIDMHTWMVDWCERVERELAAGPREERIGS